MINKLKLFTLLTAMTLATPQVSYGSDETQGEGEVSNNSFEILPIELTYDIVKRAAVGQARGDVDQGNLALVCQEWHLIIEAESQVDKDLWKVLHGIETPEDEVIYQIFRNMQLIYKPAPHSDEGMIRLSIPMGHNPFKYTFDLSSCGDRDRHMVITNDLERFFIIGGENENKLVVYFGPHFWVNKNIDSLSKPLNAIMTSWEAEQEPVGIFWRWGNWTSQGWFDYLTDKAFRVLSKFTMYENLTSTRPGMVWAADVANDDGQKCFTFVCKPKLDL
jgi:hypothetical protein